jgi:hypothetical protein
MNVDLAPWELGSRHSCCESASGSLELTKPREQFSTVVMRREWEFNPDFVLIDHGSGAHRASP